MVDSCFFAQAVSLNNLPNKGLKIRNVSRVSCMCGSAQSALKRRGVIYGGHLAAVSSALAFSDWTNKFASAATLSETSTPGPESEPEAESISTGPKKVFVAGATGSTGKKIVKELLEKGVKVIAGVRNFEKAKELFGSSTPNLEFVLADVTEGTEKLKSAIGSDVDAVIVATGFSPGLDLTSAWKVDNLGTISLLDAALSLGVPKLVLVSSLLTNGAAVGQAFNPNYVLLNLFGLVLIAKLQAEKQIQRSGIDYTIVRPGGLRSDPPSGNIIVSPQDTLFGGSISRDSVAKVAVEALYYPEASYKIVEIISSETAPNKSFKDLFASVP